MKRCNLISRSFFFTILIAFVAMVLSAKTWAQVASPFAVSDGLVVQSARTTSHSLQPESKSTTGDDDKQGGKAARLEELKKLTYDRRPSAILKAWSEPESESEDSEFPPPPPLPVSLDDPSLLKAELESLQRNVTIGKWAEVKDYFADLSEEEAKEGYAQMVKSLASPPMPQGVDQRMAQMQVPGVGKILEANQFTLEDILAIVDACPHERERETIQWIVPLLNTAMQRGVMDGALLDLLHQQINAPEGEAVLIKPECAWLLDFSGRIDEAEPFLPTAAHAEEVDDAESLVLLARCYLARYQKEKQVETLETCWSLLQTACFLDKAEQKDREEALRLALSLVPRVREELGMAWLEKMFKEDPEFGMKIVASTGTSVSTSLQSSPQSPDSRLSNLKVQKAIVESLLEKAPERAEQWDDMIRILADTWVKEAEFSRLRDTSSSRGPRMNRDRYGNLYYMNLDEMGGGSFQNHGGNQPLPISSADMLETAPNEAWLAKLDEVLHPKFLALYAQLHLKVGEEEEAFPYIERIAESHQDLVTDLVQEFLRVWTRNHDPNASRSYTNPYMYFYGFDVKANGIPLTRSQQQRNLKELKDWVARIRELNLEELDESLLAKAFTNCHSRAEVYRLEAIEEVFGSIDDLEPETLAQLVQQMRTNLSGVWRMPADQEKAKTKRKQLDIQAEVLRGYEVSFAVVEDGLAKHPDDWKLQVARACLLLDAALFENEVAPSSEFSEKRLAALEEFHKAAESYASEVPSLKEDEQVATVYKHWFYAGLGASDLNQIDHESTPDPRQPALIREAIEALPGEAAESHMEKFANSLFTRMSSLTPAMKFDYLRAGFEIVGDNEHAHEAKEVYDYYSDLVTEIELVVRLDGPPSVGHDEPFGVFVEIHHTKEIERESGGFAKYLQNQQNARYAYNYGRPLNNYRDKFEEGVRAALQENFDVQSVTFADEKNVRSLSTDKVNWRNTPYAYLLLKPNGPQIDKLPSLKIDLDFLDTSGYVVLPITSAPVPIDAAPEQTTPRPYENVSITQILDEREAESGNLKLELKATGRGLIPPLEQLVDVRASDFEVADTEDQGVLVSKFDSEADGLSVISERTWVIDYAGRTDLAELPTTFHFPEPKAEPKEISYMRYEDADLNTVESTVSLIHDYGEVRQIWPWVLVIGCLLLLALGVGVYSLSNQQPVETEDRWRIPETLTPFNVLALLRGIENANGFDPATRQDLAHSIKSIEHFYFAGNGQGNGEHPNLRAEAEKWVSRI